jgi:hypothetical protein
VQDPAIRRNRSGKIFDPTVVGSNPTRPIETCLNGGQVEQNTISTAVARRAHLGRRADLLCHG